MIHSRSILCAATLLLAGTHRAAAAHQDPPPKSTQSQSPSQAKPQKLRNPLNDLLDEAQAAFDKNDYEAAIPPLQKFIAEKPDVAYAHFQLAYAYTALKRPDEARAEYARCVALDPKMAEAQLNLGILFLESQPAAAILPLRKAVELLPSQSRPRYLLGLAYESTGDLTAAAESFEGASRLDSKDADALTHLGIILYRNKRPAEAEAKFRDVLQLQPQSPAALQGLAQSLDVQKKPEAVDAYRKYLAVQPNDAAARARLIHVLIERQ
ncbi:MAG: tetratricopeptide repeat protein, partial [Candidatus Acidiferrum sp.]